MFCPTCGTQHPDDAKFCPGCGAPNAPQQAAAPQQPAPQEPTLNQQPVYQQPVAPQQPVYQQPAYQPPVSQPVVVAPATAYQKKLAVLLAIVAIFALFVGLAHTFCLVDVPVSVDVEVDTSDLGLGGLGNMMGGGMSALSSIEIDGSVGNIYISPDILSEAFDLLDTATGGQIEASFSMGYVGLIGFGLLNLLIAVIGVLFYLRARSNNALYTQFFGGFIKAKTPAGVMGILGVGACLLEIVCMWFTGFNEEMMGQSAGISVGVHWITWVALIIYGALAASQFLAIDKEEA